jgi:hypothetical protein
MENNPLQTLKTAITYPARFASVLAVLMLGLGSCCCQGALIAGLLPHGKSCCEKPVQPCQQQDDCHCAGQVLSEGKIEAVSSGPLMPKPAANLHDVLPPACVRSVPSARHAVPAVAHAPPLHLERSLLQVWLI